MSQLQIENIDISKYKGPLKLDGTPNKRSKYWKKFIKEYNNQNQKEYINKTELNNYNNEIDLLLEEDKDNNEIDLLKENHRDNNENDLLLEEDKHNTENDLVLEEDIDNTENDLVSEEDRENTENDLVLEEDRDNNENDLLMEEDRDNTENDLVLEEDRDNNENDLLMEEDRDNNEIKENYDELYEKIKLICQDMTQEQLLEVLKPFHSKKLSMLIHIFLQKNIEYENNMYNNKLNKLLLDNYSEMMITLFKYEKPKMITNYYYNLSIDIKLNIINLEVNNNEWFWIQNNNNKLMKLNQLLIFNYWDKIFADNEIYITFILQDREGIDKLVLCNKCILDTTNNNIISFKFNESMIQNNENNLIKLSNNLKSYKGIICLKL